VNATLRKHWYEVNGWLDGWLDLLSSGLNGAQRFAKVEA
jgi:hypothetical protein